VYIDGVGAKQLHAPDFERADELQANHNVVGCIAFSLRMRDHAPRF
jgi:hypothetical protein